MQQGCANTLLHNKIFRSLLRWNFMKFNGGRRRQILRQVLVRGCKIEICNDLKIELIEIKPSPLF